MTRAANAWQVLQTALQTSTPNCEDNDLFVLDWFPAEVLEPICKSCPIFTQCKSYANNAKPTGGAWAGIRFDTNGKRIK